MKLTKQAKTAGIILGVLLFLGLWLGANYNSLVSSKNSVDNSWAKVETDYQRRLDLLDNYVEVAKSSQIQEQKVFGDIAKARQQYNNASSTSDKAQAASNIESINIVPRLQEAYPDLKSNATLQNLATEIAGTENSIRDRRNTFNDTATNYNNNVSRFPKNVFASMFGFHRTALFKAQAGASKAPRIHLQ